MTIHSINLIYGVSQKTVRRLIENEKITIKSMDSCLKILFPRSKLDFCHQDLANLLKFTELQAFEVQVCEKSRTSQRPITELFSKKTSQNQGRKRISLKSEEANRTSKVIRFL